VSFFALLLARLHLMNSDFSYLDLQLCGTQAVWQADLVNPRNVDFSAFTPAILTQAEVQ